jgi:hypothetical protein
MPESGKADMISSKDFCLGLRGNNHRRDTCLADTLFCCAEHCVRGMRPFNCGRDNNAEQDHADGFGSPEQRLAIEKRKAAIQRQSEGSSRKSWWR